MVVNEVRRYMEAIFERLTPAKAQEMARSIVKGGSGEQIQKLAHDLMEWSAKSRAELTALVDRQIGDQVKQSRERLSGFVEHQVREQFQRSSARLMEAVQHEVRRQMKTLGVTTKDDLDALKRRVRELERARSAERAPRSSGAAKKPAAKKPTARRPRTPSGP